MIEVLQASQLNLHDVKAKFSLVEEDSADFFTEWQALPPDLDEYERKILDQTKTSFRKIAEYTPTHEEIVKMVVISPVLSTTGFFNSPFRPVAEQPVEVEASNGDDIVRGRIDVLVVNQQIWVATIEAKEPQFHWRVGLPQTLVYMASAQQSKQTRFGLITNGFEFVFVKLQSSSGKYGLSRVFSLDNPGNDLYNIVGVLRAVSQLQDQLNN